MSLFLINTSITVLLAGLILLIISYSFREFIKNYFLRSIEHKYDKKFEDFQSAIRENEKENNFIRDALLTTISSNDNIIKSRQLNAIDDLWSSFLEKKKDSWLIDGFAPLNIKVLVEECSDDVDMLKKVVMPFSGRMHLNKLKHDTLKAESARPWLSPMIWALYLTYNAIIRHVLLQINLLSMGFDPNKFVLKKELTKLLKAVIPEINIESIENSSLPHYLNLLELKLIAELQKQIANSELNFIDIERAKYIIELASNIINAKVANPPT